jgi:hypothetical protein
MQRWLVDGSEPPRFAPIELAADGTIARDAHGNAREGVRLPELAAPIAEYHGRDDTKPGLLMIYGWARPFSREELRSLYVSRDAYADVYRACIDSLVATGGLRPDDAPTYADAAEKIAADLDL